MKDSMLDMMDTQPDPEEEEDGEDLGERSKDRVDTTDIAADIIQGGPGSEDSRKLDEALDRTTTKRSKTGRKHKSSDRIVDEDGAPATSDMHIRMSAARVEMARRFADRVGMTLADYVEGALTDRMRRDYGLVDAPSVYDTKFNELIDAVASLRGVVEHTASANTRQMDKILELARGDNYLTNRIDDAYGDADPAPLAVGGSDGDRA